MKKIILLIIIFIAGCNDSYEPMPNKSSFIERWSDKLAKEPMNIPMKKPIKFVTKVISIPSGARIELDGDYLGDTPLEINWEVGEVYSSRGLFRRNHIIKALPLYEGQYVQIKVFRGGFQHYQSDKVPKRIFFDMNLVRVPTRYEIDID